MAESSQQSNRRRFVRGRNSGRNVPISQRNTDSWVNLESFPSFPSSNSDNVAHQVDLNTHLLDFDYDTTPSSTPVGVDESEIPEEITQPSTANEKEKRKRPSFVWNYFELIETNVKPNIAKCKKCGQEYKHKTGWGTGQYKKHLLNAHKINEEPDNNMKQTTINEHTGESFHYNHLQARVGMTKFISGKALPFTLSESDEMKDYAQQNLQPSFKPVPRTTLRTDMGKLYKDMKKLLIATLASLHTKVCFTSDMWTALNGLEILCVTCHWIDIDWLMQKRVICFRAVEASHTASLIADIIINTAQQYQVSDKLLTVTFDNATNMTASVPQIITMFDKPVIGDIFHVRCSCHIINLIVQDGLQVIQSSIRRIRTAIQSIRTTPSLRRDFKTRCLTSHKTLRKLKLDIPSRWNSTYEMLELALKYKEEISAVNNAYHSGNFIDNAMWDTAQRMCSFLELFHTATNLLSGVYYPTSHLVLGRVFELAYHLSLFKDDNILQECIPVMLDKLFKYYEPFPYVLSMAACLDPRIKLEGVQLCVLQIYNAGGRLLSDIEINWYMEKVRNLLQKMYGFYVEQHGRSSRPPRPPPTTQEVSSSSSSSAQKVSYFFTMLTQKAPRPSASAGLNELAYFLGSAREELNPELTNFDILSWWKDKSNQFPILSVMARDILTIPASSVASESAFSAGKRQLDEKRSRLTGKTLEVLVCLQDWNSAIRRTQNILDAHHSSDDDIFSELSSNTSNISSDDASDPQNEDFGGINEYYNDDDY